MLINNSYLLDAGWLFFAAWSAIVAVVGIAAFGKDLIPFRAPLEPAPHSGTNEPSAISRMR